MRKPIGPRGPGQRNEQHETQQPEDMLLAYRATTQNVHPDYPSLPECLKADLSPAEYAAMPDELKRTLIYDSTMPEVGED